jgi:hypothetical protein
MRRLKREFAVESAGQRLVDITRAAADIVGAAQDRRECDRRGKR